MARLVKKKHTEQAGHLMLAFPDALEVHLTPLATTSSRARYLLVPYIRTQQSTPIEVTQTQRRPSNNTWRALAEGRESSASIAPRTSRWWGA